MAYRIPSLKAEDNTTLIRNTTGGSITGTTFTLDSMDDVRQGMFVIGTGIPLTGPSIYVANVGTSTITLNQEVTLNNAALTFSNCEISLQSIPKVVGVAIGSDNVNLTIQKSVGGLNSSDFSIDASSFKVGGRTFSQNSNSLTYTHGTNGVVFPSGILSVTLANTGTPGTTTNSVTVVVDLDDNYVMPNADTTLDFNLEGNCTQGATNLTAAYLRSYEPNNPNVTVTTNTGSSPATFENTVGTVNYIAEKYYTGNATPGTVGVIFEKTVAANSGKHFDSEPDIIISSDDENRVSYYSLSKSNRVYDSSGNLTSIKLTVSFTWQSTDTFSYHNDSANIVKDSVSSTPSTNPTVETVNGNFNYFNAKTGSNRTYTVFGSGTTPKFNLTITRASDSLTYDFDNGVFNSTSTNLSNVTIPSVQEGGYSFTVNYPSGGTTNETYNWVLTAGTGTTLGSSIPSSSPTYTVLGLAPVTQTFGFPAVSGYTITPGNSAELTASDLALSNTLTTKQPGVTITKTGGGNITLTRDVAATDWTNLNTSSFNISPSTITVTGNGTAGIAIVTTQEITQFGTTNNTSNLTLANVLPEILEGGGSPTGGFQVRWYNKINTESSFNQQTSIPSTWDITRSGYTNGTNSFTFYFVGLELNEADIEGGVPDWVDHFGDVSVAYKFRDSSYNLITSGTVPINLSTSTITQLYSGVRVVINSGVTTVTIPSDHNSGNGLNANSNHTLDIEVTYTDVAQ